MKSFAWASAVGLVVWLGWCSWAGAVGLWFSVREWIRAWVRAWVRIREHMRGWVTALVRIRAWAGACVMG